MTDIFPLLATNTQQCSDSLLQCIGVTHGHDCNRHLPEYLLVRVCLSKTSLLFYIVAIQLKYILLYILIQETYLTWSYIPWREQDGQVAGFLNRTPPVSCLTVACFDSTERIMADRRLRTIAQLDRCIANSTSTQDLGRSISEAFTYNPYDVPFALLYFCSTSYTTHTLPETGLERRSTSEDSDHSADPLVLSYVLQSTVGIPEGHILAPKEIDIHLRQVPGDEDADVALKLWSFRKMATDPASIDVRIPQELLQGIRQQGWPELPTSATVIPLFGARDADGNDLMTGTLILGINPRRPFDDVYRSWTQICSRHIAAAMNLSKSVEDAAHRMEEQAQLNRDRTTFFNRYVLLNLLISVSHELRTPLTLILGPLEECLGDSTLSVPHKDRLTLAGRNARKLLRLVNSLLDFSRVEAGKMSASFELTSLQRYTADLASLFRSAIEKGGVDYEVDTDSTEQLVWVDRGMWEVNLIQLYSCRKSFSISLAMPSNLH
jgi:signal transduction histidine kinase